ncbi:PBP1A family penicillin-binding protein [Ligilactobacillus agilis]|uniref:PBP1A family penicillin-binding protein n=1 Tax=Ligilactobacillus agilis TaxID=1601 RepID=UPI001F56E771|nr:PBP1A family penicillin-binding protein [Ligilactobacillus agilis]UNL42498.1 PBP1A family penicillin-binding protein [Ligilactobacillus agilis]UNL58099.1 PBP1A family penicillin-binding protein [Ligilactobacillus agilis]
MEAKTLKDKILTGLQKVTNRLGSFIKRKWYRYQLTRWLIVIFLSLAVVSSAYLTFIAKTTDVKGLKATLKQATQIYDVDGDKAGYLYAQKGTWVSLKQISPNVTNAVLSTEDRNFYKEYGFSLTGIGRAGLLYVKNKLTGQSGISGGGSTITQQLVKNAFLSQEQTFSRKAKELFLAVQVENDYSKKEILTMYLNNAYFGNGVWGVQDAAKRYFNVNASELSVPQAATLAGMLKSPSAYNPADHPQAARQRRNVVLGLMAANGKLSQSQLSQYQASAMVVSNGYDYVSGYKYPYYFDAVIAEAIDDYGLSETEIMNKGYKIYTSLDQNYQTQMQTAFANSSLFPYNASDGTKAQGASIAINPQTGGVAALVGGRAGSHVFRGYNRATQLKRSPGSAIKPLAVYTPALQNGYYYDSQVKDTLKSYGTNKYTPKNWNGVYSGELPLYEALALSKNTSAVWLLNKIGIQKGYASVKRFGIPLSKSDNNLSLALGGMKEGVSPYEMAAAYTAFANQGVKYQPHLIRKIVDSSGKVIVDNSKVDSKRIISKKIANEMTSMMIDVYKMGTGTSAKPYGFTIAGKTGSTESAQRIDGEDNDHWYIGYTPDVVVATWVGFDSSKYSLQNQGLRAGAGLFKTEMEGILPYTPQTKFDVSAASTMVNSKAASSSSSGQVWSKLEDAGKDIGAKAASIKDKAGSYLKGLFGY